MSTHRQVLMQLARALYTDEVVFGTVNDGDSRNLLGNEGEAFGRDAVLAVGIGRRNASALLCVWVWRAELTHKTAASCPSRPPSVCRRPMW